ncbi:MAG TPA: response regulator transcription factor [Thermoanaerobaculia bacterium]|nr:response regulator transcription factor [Thermoanaerobaculia bacterium]
MTRPQALPRILVVDDDAAIRGALARELSLAGYEVGAASDGEEGLRSFAAEPFDLVITDLAMPRADGFAVIRSIRAAGSTPILVLSVRGDEEDKVRALDLGADDYVTKPFSLRELLARVRSHLRRGRGETEEKEGGESVLRFPGLSIDRTRRTVEVEGAAVRLTPTELSILELLATLWGRPVTLRQIVGAVWHGAPGTTFDTVRVHVGSLRRKIEPDPGNPRYIGTEPWVGYRFLAEPL